jgi:nucleotide-binding universal stress UspA family protein
VDIRTVGLVATEKSFDAAALAAAAAISLREDAHLDVRCLGVSPIGMEMDFATALPTSAGVLFEAGLVEADKRAGELAAWVESALPQGVRASVEPVSAQLPGLTPAIARGARFCDLVVVPKPYEQSWHPLGPLVLEALLFGTGAPVLVIPGDGSRADWDRPFSRVVLAWNDSQEALRAARAALPLLAPGARVDVAIVDPSPQASDRSDPGGALSLWLARHGLDVEVSVLARALPRVADVLARFASDQGAEALVMGGYGHSPLREAITGGPTRTLLKETTLPLVLAH